MPTEARNPRTTHIDELDTYAMLRLINEEDALVPLVVREALPAIAQGVDLMASRIAGGGRVFYVGAGTSGRLAMLDAVECVPTFGTPPGLFQALIAGGNPALTEAVEGAEDDQDQGANDLLSYEASAQDVVVGIAASGKTPYVIGALTAARSLGCAAIAIASNRPAPILDLADVPIAVDVGSEVISGSTRMKAGTAQKLVLNMLSTGTMIKLGKVFGNLMVDVQITNQKLAVRARGIVTSVTGVDDAEADRLLAAADQQVKTAIVMAVLDCDADEARSRLETVGGRLRSLIGAPDSD